MEILLATLLGGFVSDVSVHKQSGSDRIEVRSGVVTVVTRAQHEATFVSLLNGEHVSNVTAEKADCDLCGQLLAD